jgi:hypothetical protein
MKTLTGLAAAALLAFTLTACAPAGETTTPPDTDAETEQETDTETDEFQGVTLPGTGEYEVPADAPIGGYELPENQDALPEGCSWTIYVGDDVLAESHGPFLFLTDVTTKFVTDGCPDWVQFE